MEQGQVQIYCGDGKGKTTAAVGLAVRAAGAGLRVYMGQFIKDMAYHEVSVLSNLSGVTVELYGSGRGCFIGRTPDPQDVAAAQAGLAKAAYALRQGRYDLVILDEINVACRLGLLSAADLLDLMAQRPASVELVYTGRGCPAEVLAQADLVTEMREVRHYYHTKKLLARDGIER